MIPHKEEWPSPGPGSKREPSLREKLNLWHMSSNVQRPTSIVYLCRLISAILSVQPSTLLKPPNMPLQPPDRVYTPVPSPEPRHAPPPQMAPPPPVPPPMAPPPLPPPRPQPRPLDQLSLRNTILYFTYASNLHVALMAQRCPGSIFRGPAVLRDYTPEVSPMGVVTIRPAARNLGLQVEGLVYSVPKVEMAAIRGLAPDTARRRERVIFKPYLRLSGYTAQGVAAMMASEYSIRKELARTLAPTLALDPQPVGEPRAEDAVLWTTESFRDQTDGRFAADPDKLVTLAIGNAIILGVPQSFYLERIIPHVRIPLGLRLRGEYSNAVVPVVGGVSYRTPTPSAAPSGMLATPRLHTAESIAAFGQPNPSNPYNPVARSAPPGTIDPSMGFSTPAPSAAPSEMLATPGLHTAESDAALGQPNSSNPSRSVAQGSAPPGTIDPTMGFVTPALLVAPAGISSIHGLYVADSGADLGQANPSNPYSSVAQCSAPPATIDPAMGFGAPAPDGTLATPGFYNAGSGAASGSVPPGTFNPAMGFGAPVPDGALATPGFYSADGGAASGLVTPGTFNPWTMGWGTPAPDGALATPGLYNADSGAPLSQPNFPNPQSSVHRGTMNPPPGFSTPAPLTAPDGGLETPGLYNADSSGALSQPSFSNPDGSVPHGNINPPPGFSTPAPSMGPDVDMAAPGIDTADSGGAYSQPSFYPQGSVLPESIDPAMLSTSGPSTAHGDFALGQHNFSNPHDSVPPGTIDHTMAPSTPAPSAAPGGILATPSLNTANSGIGMGQPSSSRPYGSTPSGSISRKPKGKMVDQQASSLSAPDSVFPTPGRSTATDRISNTPSTYTPHDIGTTQRDVFSNPHGSVPTGSSTENPRGKGKMADHQAGSLRAPDSVFPTPGPSTAPDMEWTSTTPSTYTPQNVGTTQRDVLSNPQGAVPTGTKRPNVDVNMVGRRTMSSTTQGKMVSRQPSKPAIQRRVSSQSSSSRALDRVIGTPGHSSGTPGTFTDSGGNAASQARNTITHPAPPAPGARREAGALTEPSMASHAGPSSASSPPMPPPTVSMAGVRQRIRDTCLNMGIPLIIPTLRSGDCFYFDDELMDAIYTVQAMKQLAWTETLADFKVVDVTHDRLLANEVALNTLQEVLEAAMKAKDEDLKVIAVKHWLKVQEGGDENERSFECLVSDDGLLRLECVLGEGRGEVLI